MTEAQFTFEQQEITGDLVTLHLYDGDSVEVPISWPGHNAAWMSRWWVNNGYITNDGETWTWRRVDRVDVRLIP